ncbi:hypothetical protein [Streptomyces coeruleorubidus]|uniref:ATP-binding protein n=1 Tax=Streptomyces coeruleorubidus TaxID=116188 RepID=A0A5J6I5W0_STRC4|nr:hypothetical protein [Streptomyces coeruleorubidus]QEV27448.1 hypothetical protein CP976_27240 [Streptomyces coeruleorubidus]GGT68437.1 hypothetical protein GCM10010256_28390 [Streptomyces coeruleorubidus]
MARHDSPKKPTAQRALTLLATAGMALGAGAATAAAGTGSVLDDARTSLGRTDARSGLQAATDTVGHTTGPVAGLKPNPLVGTGADPLDNSVGTEVADFKPVTSKELTGPVAQAQSVESIPVVGQAAGSLSQ